MRNALITGLLMATLATSAMAQDYHHDGDHNNGAQQNNGQQNGGQQTNSQQNGGWHGQHNGGPQNSGQPYGGHNNGGDWSHNGNNGGGWHSGNHGWDGGWRNDRRYDWQGWRNNNRSSFSLGVYVGPRGYGYRRFAVGGFLPGIFYSPRYWIADPYAFHLPPPPYGTHWVRYYRDALLVQNGTHRVLDVVYGIFY